MIMKKFFMENPKRLAIILVVVLGVAIWFFFNGPGVRLSEEELALKEAVELQARVGKLIVLPNNEIPTVATVTDPALLANQPFFSGTKAGDKVLIYAEAKKAILYDPELNKIINVSPL